MREISNNSHFQFENVNIVIKNTSILQFSVFKNQEDSIYYTILYNDRIINAPL